VLGTSSFYDFLSKIDLELAAVTKKAGCVNPECGGRLDVANFPRKPRGPKGVALGPDYEKRRSFCCRIRDCRVRATPPSVRFLGRKVYLGAVVLVAAAMRHGTTPKRLAKLRELLGISVSPDTLERWRIWWRETFPQTRWWKAHRGRFHLPVDRSRMPASLLERFHSNPQTRLIRALKFLASCTSAKWVA
jgi:hypothetical protein